MKSNNNKYSQIIFKKMILRILIYTISFTFLLALLLIIGTNIADQYIWQPLDPLYLFLTNIRSHLLFVWSLGIICIIVSFIAYKLTYIILKK